MGEDERGKDADALAPSVETHPKRTTSFVARLTHKNPVAKRVYHYDLATRIAMEREDSKYWARILLLVFLGFVVNERTAKLRQEKMKQWMRRATRKAKIEEELAEEATRANVLEAAQEKAQQAEEEQRKKMQKEQNHLYGESDGGDGEDGGNGDGDDAFEGDQQDEADGDDGEEEEEILLGRAQESPLAQAKSHVD